MVSTRFRAWPYQHPISALLWGHSDQCGSSLVSHLPRTLALSGPQFASRQGYLFSSCPYFPNLLYEMFYFLNNDDDEIVILQYCCSVNVSRVPGIVHALSFLFVTAALWRKSVYLHFTDHETDSERFRSPKLVPFPALDPNVCFPTECVWRTSSPASLWSAWLALKFLWNESESSALTYPGLPGPCATTPSGIRGPGYFCPSPTPEMGWEALSASLVPTHGSHFCPWCFTPRYPIP